WGQGFPAPLFSGEFDVASQALVKDKHLKLQLTRGRMGQTDRPPPFRSR
ncbi:hypothetical protein G5C45_22385, partial [Burkholderia pseudomallei]|nr:hypothetical protein [Burkholderia pseudomallei]